MTKYTKEHEWIKQKGSEGIWQVGISDYAQEQLGDVVSIELPDVGAKLTAGESCAVIESVKAASDIYSPFSGEVTAINEELGERPELVNEKAESDGWLFEVKVAGEVDLSGFMDGEEYSSFTSA